MQKFILMKFRRNRRNRLKLLHRWEGMGIFDSMEFALASVPREKHNTNNHILGCGPLPYNSALPIKSTNNWPGFYWFTGDEAAPLSVGVARKKRKTKCRE